MDQYDAITIGSGLAGLGAAAVLARAGQRVLLLERNAECGGAATVYRHGRLAIEASLHEIDALGLHYPHHGLLHRLAAHAAQDYLDAAAPGVARSKWEFSELG